MGTALAHVDVNGYFVRMKCPACETNDLLENSEACPACGFELGQLEKLMGLPPRLQPGVNDLAKVLNEADRKKLKEKLVYLGLQFPQCRFAVVVLDEAVKVPLPLYAFWLFNRGGVAAPMEKQGECRLVMLTLEIKTNSVLCMVGYGLEPFFTPTHLQRVIHACQPAMADHDYAEAIVHGLEEIAYLLEQSAESIPQAFGLHPEDGEDEQEEEEETFAY